MMIERGEIIKKTKRLDLISQEYKIALFKVVEDFLDKGLLGKHELRVVPPIATKTEGKIEGRISGSLFHFSGLIEGGAESQPSVRFAWITNNERRNLIISEIPADKLIIQQAEGQGQPSIQFELNTPHFMRISAETEPPLGFKIAATSYPHPNNYLRGNNLRVARVTLGQEDFEELQTLVSKRFLP